MNSENKGLLNKRNHSYIHISFKFFERLEGCDSS